MLVVLSRVVPTSKHLQATFPDGAALGSGSGAILACQALAALQQLVLSNNQLGTVCILDVVPYIVSPPAKTKKQSERRNVRG